MTTDTPSWSVLHLTCAVPPDPHLSQPPPRPPEVPPRAPQDLNLDGCSQLLDDSVTLVAGACRGLRCLHLDGEFLTDASLQAVARGLPRIRPAPRPTGGKGAGDDSGRYPSKTVG